MRKLVVNVKTLLDYLHVEYGNNICNLCEFYPSGIFHCEYRDECRKNYSYFKLKEHINNAIVEICKKYIRK